MSFYLRILTSFRLWIVVFGCVFLGLVLGDVSPLDWVFQQPTYLVGKDVLGQSEYMCDPAQTECKVNFDFTASIPKEEAESHYACMIDFGFGVTTGEEQKCNPGTIIFPVGDAVVHVVITHLVSSSIVREGTITIHHLSSDTGGDGNTGDDGNMGDGETPPIYSIGLTWQNTTHLLSKEDASLTEYTCDPNEENCIINPLFTPQKNTQDDTAHLTCLVTADFDLGVGADPCNPLQSSVPTGDHTITVQVLQKSDSSLVVTHIVLIKNPVRDTTIDPARVTMQIEWQSPTYLLQKEDISLTEYVCDSQESECKFNLLVSPGLDGTPSSDVTCLITADFEIIPTNDPCNPNISIIPAGEHFLHIQILQKSDMSLLVSRDIVFKNIPQDIIIDPTRITTFLTWQSPTYLLQKENTALAEYTCDVGLLDCKINLLVTPLLDGIESTQLTCEITADFELVPTSDPCNPNTSLVPLGDHMITVNIIQKSDHTLLTKQDRVIKNPLRTSGGRGGGGGSIYPSLNLETSRIVVQSGLDGQGVCRSDTCQVNFLAEVPSGALCHWDFGGGVFETAETDKKCNPGYVKFPANARVVLTVSDPYSSHTFTQSIEVVHEDQVGLPTEKPEPHIDVQGVLGKNKRLINGGIQCALGTSEHCSLNFTADKTLNATSYFWSFGNGHTSERKNPGTEEYGLGLHRVILRVTSASGISLEQYFTVEVVTSFEETLIPCVDCEKMRGKLIINAVLANPPHADTVEWVEIKNTSSETYTLDACLLSDESKKYSLSGMMNPGKTLRLRQMQTGISLGNSHDILEIHCGNILIDSFSWDFILPSGYILRREVLDRPPVKVQVIDTVDGDTVDVLLQNKKTRVRLLGVDTPETVHPRKEIEKFGKEASDFTKKILAGKTIWLTFDQDPIDHYGRTLAYIWECEDDFDVTQCQLFNARLITEGYARMERRFDFMQYESFDTLEKEAKKKKVGIWSDEDVSKILGDMSTDERILLEQQQEKEYLELQQELLKLAQEKCEKEGICEDIATWVDITQNMTTFSVHAYKDGFIKVSGRTWTELPIEVLFFQGEKLTYKADIISDTVGAYTLSWYPKIGGEYRIVAVFRDPISQASFSLEKNLTIDTLSEHVIAPLEGHIVVQGKMTKNRWIGTDRIFYCQSRGLCSLNVVAEYNRQKNLIYTWKLPNGDKFIGKNPTSFKLGYGRYIIELTVRDEITGEEKRDILIIQHHPIPKTAKKTSSAREKYILDFKDATKDIGGGVLPENTFSLSQSLLALFVLGVLAFLLFGIQRVDIVK